MTSKSAGAGGDVQNFGGCQAPVAPVLTQALICLYSGASIAFTTIDEKTSKTGLGLSKLSCFELNHLIMLFNACMQKGNLRKETKVNHCLNFPKVGF